MLLYLLNEKYSSFLLIFCILLCSRPSKLILRSWSKTRLWPSIWTASTKQCWSKIFVESLSHIQGSRYAFVHFHEKKLSQVALSQWTNTITIWGSKILKYWLDITNISQSRMLSSFIHDVIYHDTEQWHASL